MNTTTNTTTSNGAIAILNKSIIIIALVTGFFLLCVILTDALLKYNDVRIERGVQERMKQLRDQDAENKLPV